MKKLEGIKGWLLVYVIVLFSSILTNFLGIIGWLFDGNFFSVIIMGLILFFLIRSVVLILKKKEEGIGFNKFTLLMLFILNMIGEIYYIIYIDGITDAGLIGYEIGGSLVYILPRTIIWYLYFVRSKRVKNTLIN